jgi:hypothetical protein
MAYDFEITPTIHSEKVLTTRLGTTALPFADADKGKFVKLAAKSEYDLAAAGDTIEGVVTSYDGKADGFAIGGISRTGYVEVTLDGLQATPGTGAIAVGDYVVVGTVTPLGTKLPGPPRVVKATDQGAAASGPFKARLVQAEATSVGTVGVVELF